MKKLSTKKTVTTTVLDRYEVEPGTPVLSQRTVNGRKQAPQLEGEGPLKSRPSFVAPEFWSLLPIASPWGDDRFRTLGNEPKTLEEAAEAIRAGNVAYMHHAGHMVFDLRGRPVPFAMRFDYIGTAFVDRRMDVDAGLKHFEKHPWCANRPGGPVHMAGGEVLSIKEVPYYNRDAGHRYLDLVLFPDAESYGEMYDRAVKERPDYPSVRVKEYMRGLPIYSPDRDWLGIAPFLREEKDEDQ